MGEIFPFLCEGTVVHGFGRGSTELGIPTANFDRDSIKSIMERGLTKTGIYYGWGRVLPEITTYPMVMSSGWNPHYGNTERSVEAHLINATLAPFYGAKLRIVVSGYLRPEQQYVSKDALIEDIHRDISNALEKLKDNADAALLQ